MRESWAPQTDGTYGTYRTYGSCLISLISPISLIRAQRPRRPFAVSPLRRVAPSPRLASLGRELLPNSGDQKAVLAADDLRAKITNPADDFSPVAQGKRDFESNVI